MARFILGSRKPGRALPPAGSGVADQKRRRMGLAARGEDAEGLEEAVDLRLVAGHQRPTGAGVELFAPGIETLRRVGSGIDADGDQRHIAVAEEPLHAREGRPHRRTDGRAGGEDEVHDHHAVLDQVGVEMPRGPGLIDDRRIGDVEFYGGNGECGGGDGVMFVLGQRG
jgi:hypothetical protein